MAIFRKDRMDNLLAKRNQLEDLMENLREQFSSSGETPDDLADEYIQAANRLGEISARIFLTERYGQ